jgi:hypothetical protein
LHDAFDAEGLSGDARTQDVGVVAVRDGCERSCVLDPGVGEVIAVEAESDDLGAGEVVGQALEGAPVLVDDRDGVPGRFERAGEFASYAQSTFGLTSRLG